MKNEKTLRNRGADAVRDEHVTDQIFWENEVKANLLMGRFLLLCAGGFAVCWMLNVLGVLAIGKQYELLIFPAGLTVLLLSGGICLLLKGERKWMKHFTMLSLILTLTYLDTILTYNVPLFIIVPVSFSCWYYSRTFTVQVFLLSTVFFAISAYTGACVNMNAPDQNFATGELSSYIRVIMLQSFLPKWMLFAVISAVCYVIASRGRTMVLEQDRISKFQTRVETELDMATRIQAQALPEVSDLPSCRFRQFDLAAKMQPAREVGGDFYDFFYLDDSHLALMIADVADKGIAASLYMMMSKLMLDNKLTVLQSPGLVLETVNRQLHKKSTKGMFVTVWLGVLDLRTGDMITANAGHEYPILKLGDQPFALFRDKHGFVLGGVERMQYKETRLHLEEGDTLFVYTDGVTEANDEKEAQFGEARLVSVLNRNKECDMKALIQAVKQEIDAFSANTTQFDDMTMLAFRLGAPMDERKITVEPVMKALETVQNLVNRSLPEGKLPELRAKKLSICVDEVFSNIVKYSGATAVSVTCAQRKDRLQLTFSDDGAPFDPLTGTAPDLSVPLASRVQGGLGIHIIKNYADDVSYARQGEYNILTLTMILSDTEER